MVDCKECRFADIIRIGHMDFDIPNCQLDIPDWLKCRNNNFRSFQKRDTTKQDTEE